MSLRLSPIAVPLHSTGFRRYVIGQLPSVTCSWAQVVAVSWVVLQVDPRALGWVVALQFLPSLMLGPWFGALVDRCDRRKVLMLAEAGLALVAIGYSAAAVLGVLDLPAVLALASAWGVVNALDTPARRSLVPLLVPPDRAGSAAALTGTVLLLGMTAGTAIGAWLVASVGVGVTFAVNAASFALDLVVLASITVGPSPRVRRAPRQVREGLDYVRHSPDLRAAMLAVAIVAVLAFAIQVSVPVLGRLVFRGGPDTIGMLMSASTGGGLLATLTFAAQRSGQPAALRRAPLILATGLLGTALAPGVMIATAGLAVVGFGWSYLLAAVIARLQTADPRLLGRVMSLFSVVLLGGSTIGAPIAAALSAAAGPRAPFAVGAAAAMVAAFVVRRGQLRR